MASAPLSPEMREHVLNSPAEHPPPGIQPNFVSPSSFRQLADILMYASFALATVVFAVRMYAQLRVIRKMGFDDYFLMLAWVVYAFAFLPVGALIAAASIGVHQWNITVRLLGTLLFRQYANFIIWDVIILLLKITILLQYLRIFVPSGVRNLTFWASYILLWGNVVYYFVFAFLQIFCCSPREKFWDRSIVEGYCMDFFLINVSGAVVCLLSDILILLLPQRVVFKLHLPLKKKLGLCALFAIGIFACVSSAARLYYDIHLWKVQEDITFLLGKISIWGCVELPAGFLIACLPSVPKTVNHVSTKTWCMQLEMSLRSPFHLASEQLTQMSERRVTSIGGHGKRDKKGTVVSDVEFRDLVARTDSASLAASKTTIGEV